jgi:sterol desaturase/sphingolipid hydroxylase (fatty acid hydroxylase superfamily)
MPLSLISPDSTLSQPMSHLAAGLVLVGLWTVEALFPLHLGRDRRLTHGLSNLGLALINAVVFQACGAALVFATEFAASHHWGLLSALGGPAWWRWVAAVLLIDLWQYLWHRINHQIPWLWRFHSVHHSDAEMDVTSGVRFHTMEIGFSFLARLLVLPLLGVSVPQLLLYEMLALPVILFQHSNLRLSERMDRRLRWFLVTPGMHQVHHSRWQPETDSNFSSLLSVWDRMLGTFRRNPHPETIQLGLDGWKESEWRRLPGMLRTPFRRRLPGETGH